MGYLEHLCRVFRKIHRKTLAGMGYNKNKTLKIVKAYRRERKILGRVS